MLIVLDIMFQAWGCGGVRSVMTSLPITVLAKLCVHMIVIVASLVVNMWFVLIQVTLPYVQINAMVITARIFVAVIRAVVGGLGDVLKTAIARMVNGVLMMFVILTVAVAILLKAVMTEMLVRLTVVANLRIDV
jgi:hypothetical protein